MVKSCREIQKDIEELKRKLQQNRLIEFTLLEMAEHKKCQSNNASDMCLKCNCWKSVKEYIL
jgi:hypothetical protein